MTNSTPNRRYPAIPKGIHEKRVCEYFSTLEKSNQEKLESTSPNIKSNFLICFSNRCGSTLVASILSKLGLCGPANRFKNYEFYNHDFVIQFCKANNISNLRDFTYAIMARFSSTENYFTTKISSDQLFWLTKENILGNLLKKNTFIYVKRRNVLAQAISLNIAHQTQHWTSLHDQNVAAVPVFQPDLIVESLLQINRINALLDLYFELHSIEPLTVFYEDIVEDEGIFLSLLEPICGKELKFSYDSSLPIKKQGNARNRSWEEKMRELYSF